MSIVLTSNKIRNGDVLAPANSANYVKAGIHSTLISHVASGEKYMACFLPPCMPVIRGPGKLVNILSLEAQACDAKMAASTK